MANSNGEFQWRMPPAFSNNELMKGTGAPLRLL